MDYVVAEQQLLGKHPTDSAGAASQRNEVIDQTGRIALGGQSSRQLGTLPATADGAIVYPTTRWASTS